MISYSPISRIRYHQPFPRSLGGWAGPSYLPDGDLILFFDNVFQAMRADGTDVRPVDIDGPGLSDLSQGFSYIGHWIPNP